MLQLTGQRFLPRPVLISPYLEDNLSHLSVTFSAVRTDISLDVFGLLVLGDVLQQGGLVSETLVAGLAFVRFVSLMTPGVGLQVGQLGEGLGAT